MTSITVKWEWCNKVSICAPGRSSYKKSQFFTNGNATKPADIERGLGFCVASVLVGVRIPPNEFRFVVVGVHSARF